MTLANGTLEKAADAINPPALSQDNGLTFVDLFCGIGGFHTAASALGLKAVFACDIAGGFIASAAFSSVPFTSVIGPMPCRASSIRAPR